MLQKYVILNVEYCIIKKVGFGRYLCGTGSKDLDLLQHKC